VALSALQERVAALVAGLPESAAFVLAGGAAMAAHDMLDRTTRDLDYFAGPDDAVAVQRFADAFEDAAKAGGLEVRRTRQAETFVRFEVRDGEEDCEVDLGIDYRALESVPTRYGPALDVRELGADKVLAIFGRAEPRDFVDLAELTRRVPFDELLALASAKDPGLDLAVLDQFMERVQAMRPGALGLDAESYRALVEQVQRWRAHIRQLLARERGTGRAGPGHGLEL
jgi:hypothetical protein